MSSSPPLSIFPNRRERVLLGLANELTDGELLALLIGTGSSGESASQVANSLLELGGGLQGLARLGPNVLAKRRGVGPAKAARLVAAFEIGRRGLRAPARLALRSWHDVVTWAHPRLALLEHEEVWLLSLDGRNRLKSERCIARGGLHGCALLPHDILRPALRDGASAIILVHNHPSGDPTPSTEDVCMTEAVARGCSVVSLPLLDHVIVACHGATSLAEAGAVEKSGAPQAPTRAACR